MPRTTFPCRWLTCQECFEDPEDLFAHLSDDHIGRKATNNLCLQCQWNGCGTVAAKRDHLASHLRVHLPLKPHQCTLCSKNFKRPQDLKKHERIHTVEHQASLLSNQPGYKPVRRRRKPNTTVTVTVTPNPLPAKKVTSELSSDLSSCSPSFSFGDTSSFTDNKKMEPENYFDGYLQDPLQEFIDDVLQNQALTPNYDTDMMDRLDSIAPMLQYNEWSLPCEPEAIPALQNWLEQLSANIQTDDNIYPNILTSKSVILQEPLLSAEDYDLYPKLNNNNVWTSVSPNKQNSASESSFANTPPSYSPQNNLKPQFWSPGYITSPTYASPNYPSPSYPSPIHASSINSPPPLPPRPNYQPHVEYYTPSDAIDFNSIPTFEQVEPNLVFETSKKEESSSVTPLLNDNRNIFNEKKELVHMMNLFSSPRAELIYVKKEHDSVAAGSVETTRDNNDDGKDSEQETSEKETNDTSEQEASEASGSEEEQENSDEKCPYADLVGLIQNMKVEDEESIRKRHALLVDKLTKIIAQRTFT